MLDNPFVYPTKRHSRTLSPPEYSDYRKYKPHLREEFGHKCVYCRVGEHMKGPEAFGVDHYKPASKFPSLVCEYTNLFLACNVCNQRKGADWPSRALLAKGRFVPNPCEHVMTTHLRVRGDRVETRSLAGEYAEELFGLNDRVRVEYRARVLRLIRRMKGIRAEANARIRQIEAELRRTSSAKAVSALKSELQTASAHLDEISRDLEFLGAM